MVDKVRLFFGFGVPLALQEAFLPLLEGIAEARFTRPSNLHCTLRFVGEIESKAIEALSTHVAATLCPQAVPMGIEGITCWSNGVLHAVVEPHALLLQAREHLEATLEQFGLPREARPFRPHITLARLPKRVPASAIDAYLERHRNFDPPTWQASALQLFASLTTPEGVVYQPLAVFESAAAKAS